MLHKITVIFVRIDTFVNFSVLFVSQLDSPVIPAWADETLSKVTESLQDIPDLTNIDFTTLNDLQEVNQGTPRVHQALSASQKSR